MIPCGSKYPNGPKYYGPKYQPLVNHDTIWSKVLWWSGGGAEGLPAGQATKRESLSNAAGARRPSTPAASANCHKAAEAGKGQSFSEQCSQTSLATLEFRTKASLYDPAENLENHANLETTKLFLMSLENWSWHHVRTLRSIVFGAVLRRRKMFTGCWGSLDKKRVIEVRHAAMDTKPDNILENKRARTTIPGTCARAVVSGDSEF